MKILFTVVFGILEIALFSFILKGIFIALIAHSITMLTSASIIIFLLWLGQKINNMAQVTQGADTDGKS